MSNSFSFVGHVGGDAELKEVGQGQVCEFSVAITTGFGDRKTTTWVRNQLWGARAEKIVSYIQKGKKVFVIGELTQRKYTTKEGQDKTSLDVRVDRLEFCDSKGNTEGRDPDEDNEPTPF